ncbi:MAG: thiosulfate sulfurtransferase GlpE [Betaproteobacteria bacterium]|nr:thiosulfate sulfurtransferase GlpE [Betaproteobacteria bacterium]
MDASIDPRQLSSQLGSPTPPLVIDVRRETVYATAPDRIAGALRRDPEAVAAWGPALPQDQPVVVYCVHGHQVSQNAAAALRAQGLQARFLDGGLEAWRAAGGAIEARSGAQ